MSIRSTVCALESPTASSALPRRIALATTRRMALATSQRIALAMTLLLALTCLAGPSAAFDPDPPSAAAIPAVPSVARMAPLLPRLDAPGFEAWVPVMLRPPLDERSIPTAIQQIGDRLRRLPFRPVSIGEEPRTPDDPEPGAGMTVFIRF